jgi:isoaspartyl peptidase/L-asparaginase-like protein (Ntn-hydrolase superfamily)
VRIPEADPENQYVGYGGLPNRDGVVQLDAAICDGDTLNAGSVAGLEGIRHPISVARRVLSETPHVLLVGAGAKQFALSQGFTEENLLTPEAEAAWELWKAKRSKSTATPANHDTVGLLVRTAAGSMAAACTTSGLAWKLPGRVGDSPLVGHGLYCDSKAGAAAATGVGEEIIKVAGSYQVVEFMRQGMDPSEAIDRVIRRIVARDPANAKRMAAFVAIRSDGVVGYGTMGTRFEVAVAIGDRTELIELEASYPR